MNNSRLKINWNRFRCRCLRKVIWSYVKIGKHITKLLLTDCNLWKESLSCFSALSVSLLVNWTSFFYLLFINRGPKIFEEFFKEVQEMLRSLLVKWRQVHSLAFTIHLLVICSSQENSLQLHHYFRHFCL